MKDVLVIGNKPYKQLPMDNLLDRFENNYRCGQTIVGTTYNNGTKFDKVGLCNHTWERLYTHPISREAYIKYYNHIDSAYTAEFWDHFQENKSKYNEILYAEHKPHLWNQMLKNWGCPYRFTKISRVGQDLIFENLLKQNKVFVTNFSLYDKTRIGWGGKYPSGYDENNTCHSKDDEINILFWLHNHHYIDVTLCMLEDLKIPTLKCKDIQPTSYALNILMQEYGDVKIIT